MGRYNKLYNFFLFYTKHIDNYSTVCKNNENTSETNMTYLAHGGKRWGGRGSGDD